ncbi:MAG: hypothetical protein QOE46_709 [Acidobacteriota bacterium]|jgi:hypothetical protein|nr:hypothetical protein [Acidobacteriota bacterium]
MSHTKALLFLLISLSVSAASEASAQVRQRQTGASRSVEASSFPGADLGARINAADHALGAAVGEIVARGGGRISTQIIISERHTLRLMPGTYAPDTTGIPLLLKPGSAVVGSGWDNTILLESTAQAQFTVISAYKHSQRNGDADSDLSVRDLQVKGANSGFNSAPQAVSLGNCTNCVVDRVWINSTRSIGIQLGGSAVYGNFASNSRVTNCLFTHVASQNLALVNGSDIIFENNRFESPGQDGGPGSTVIDLEPNDADDRIENVVIRNNLLDARANIIQAGSGIVIQAGSVARFGPVLVEGNTIYGGRTTGNVTNSLSNGIYAFGASMKGVTIRNNNVTRVGQCGLRIEGAGYIVTGNQFADVGGGGTPGFYMADVSNSRIEGNSFRYSGIGPADGTVNIVGSFKNNVVRNNPGMGFPPNIH